ncbi:MAG: hypothetical protein ACOY5V_04810 [Pseudomonadota bacterium]
MKEEASTKTGDLEIPKRKREQLGRGVRGKDYKRFTQGSNVAVLRPEISKAFPTSEAVNDALASYLASAREARVLTRRAGARKRQTP